MTERVYTFQQNLIIQDIERLSYVLDDPRSSKRIKAQLFRSIQRAVYSERSIPERLKPDNYFSSYSSAWRGRADIPMIKAWLVEIHRYFDDSHGRTALR